MECASNVASGPRLLLGMSKRQSPFLLKFCLASAGSIVPHLVHTSPYSRGLLLSSDRMPTEKTRYPAGSTVMRYFPLPWLSARGVRVCDMRSCALEPNFVFLPFSPALSLNGKSRDPIDFPPRVGDKSSTTKQPFSRKTSFSHKRNECHARPAGSCLTRV